MSDSTRTKEKISDFIKEVTEEILNKEVTGYDNTFVEIGLKSVDIPFFIKKVSNEFNIKLEVETIFKYPTINRYSELIFNRLNNISVYSEDEKEKAPITNEKEEVAIVGMSCRFPNGANNPTKYWDILTEGKSGIVDMPKERWDVDKYYSEDKKESGKMYVKRAGFLDVPIKKFDAQFFNISPKEAEAMDPQQRLLLELVWEAFEASGSDIREYYGTNTGVYLAIAGEEYSFAHCRSGNLNKVTEYSLTGCTFSTACGRVSYTFGFEGPAMAIDTACSSALTAVHVACKAIESGEVDTAVVAGVNMILTPLIHVCFSRLGAIAVDGQSKAFDASANGFGRGEGLAVIILKRVKDARANNDNILGIIKGTAINQDGKSNGLTAPNGAAQEKVILKALKDANLKGTDISYVEMHGTGTVLGDPIEVDAITKTYCKNRIIEKPLKIGSVKSNIGHLEATAGLASIIKVLLSFKNEMIPGNLHFTNPNPLIDWETSPIKVVDCNTNWKRGKKIRRVGINGFGFGGSNAHVILEEPEIFDVEEKNLNDPRYILKVSSKTKEGLRNNIKNTIEFIDENEDMNFRDFIYTNNINKSDFDYRFVVSGRDKNDITEKMEAYVENNIKEDIFDNSNIETSLSNKKIVFLYTGQGSQYVGMGEELYKNNLAFKDAFNECDRLFEPYLSKSLVDLIYSKDFSNKYIERTLYAQPLIFSIEYALSKFWKSIGIEPDIVLGHSIGEYAAAVISDVISLNDGVRLVAARCRLMDSAPGEGHMISLYTSLQEANLLIENYKDRVSVAVHNAKNNIVISGERKSIEEIAIIAENKGIKVKELHVSHAFHSQMMEPILDEFKEIALNIEYKTSKYDFMSTKLARYVEKDEVLDANYWTRHIAEKVDFYNALKSISKQNNIVFVEVGATNTLCALTRLILGEETVIINSLDIKKDALSVIGNAIGQLYCNNFNIIWEKCNFNKDNSYKRVSLPIYQFNKEEYWIEPVYEQDNNTSNKNIDYHPLIGEKISTPYLKNTLIYQSVFTNESPYFMKEHVIFDTAISPAAAHMAMLLSIAKEYQNPFICTIENVEFHAPLIATEEEKKVVQFIIQDTNLEQMKFEIVSKEKESRNERWIKHCKGNIALSQENVSDKRIKVDELKAMYPEENSGFNMYRVMEKFGFKLGDGFTRIFKTWRKNDEGVCYVEPDNNVPELKEYTIYAGTLDSIFQSIFSVSELSREMDNETDKYSMKTTIPISVKKIKYYYRDAKEYWCHVKVNNSQKSGVVGDITVYNEKGEIVFEIEKMMAKLTDRESLLKELNNNGNNLLYSVNWNKENAKDKKVKFTEKEVMVVFNDDESIVNRFKSKLLEYDANTITVIQGNEYIECDNNLYYLNYKNKKDFEKLLYSISNKYKESSFKLLYISASNETEITYDKLVSKEEQECSGLLHLVQVITELNHVQKMKLKVIVNNVHSLENSKISIYQSTLWGFSQVIRLEHTQLWDGIIDLDYDMLINNVDLIIKEVKNSKDKQVVIRNNNRYVPRLVKSKKNIEEVDITIDKNASYIITGGTGNIGQVYTEYLSDKGARNIILLSRREPNEEVLNKINLFNTMGVNVYVENIDVSNRNEILSFVKRLKDNSIEIKGVIHTAGILEDKMIRDQDWSSFEKLFRTKVWGTYNLHEALIHENLDFFIMTSSITAIAGNIGQANYAAANYYMNAFAEYRRSLGMPAMAVCWGAWADGGMVTQGNDIMKNIYAKGLYSISKELGKKMIDKVFNKDIASIIVADANWKMFAEKTGVDEVTEFLSTFIEEKDLTNNKSTNEEDLLFNLKSLDKENRNEYLLKKLQQITAEIMGFNNINNLSIDKTFTEQGADSLIIFSIRNEIKKLINEEIDISVFFNYPSLRKLSEYLLEEIIVFHSIEEKEVEKENQVKSDETVEDILLEITSLID